MTLFTSFTHAHKHMFGTLLPRWYDYMEKKNHFGKMGFLICENRILAVILLSLSSRDGRIFACNQKFLSLSKVLIKRDLSRI